ncbi:MAG TPA: hypothetical protein PK165_00695 [bacterium]|nr:hypothetical protein [bacterium]HOL48989.1 hypothetical protein [bacterium]HPO51333.1 hypothetical protein [bacterium]HXK44415.1 hypothetical protein [bacterium]
MSEKEKTRSDGKKVTQTLVEKTNIRCRVCFIVDGYYPDEKKCRHCGARLFEIDRY